MKNTITEKSSLDGFNGKMEKTENKTSEAEDRQIDSLFTKTINFKKIIMNRSLELMGGKKAKKCVSLKFQNKRKV